LDNERAVGVERRGCQATPTLTLDRCGRPYVKAVVLTCFSLLERRETHAAARRRRSVRQIELQHLVLAWPQANGLRLARASSTDADSVSAGFE